VNAVLDLAKIEAGAMDASAAAFDLPAFLADLSDTGATLAQPGGNRFTLAADPALATLSTDEAKLRQCLTILLSNAAKFTKGGEITLTVRAGGPGRATFEVHDTGEGIAADKIATLFRPFSQGDDDLITRRRDGAGLGLAIAQRIAQLLDGEISVTSTTGQGSVFTLTIATTLDGDEGEDARLETLGEDAPIVLVIDDEANSRRLVRHALSRVGFAARSAPSAETGLDLAGRIDPALIVLDIRLPDRSGWEVLAVLRADPKTAAIPILVLSVEDDRGRAISLGASDHFTKPADRSQLAAAIVRCARRPCQTRESVATPAVAKTGLPSRSA
jgi:CheY-like chemotaxis protein